MNFSSLETSFTDSATFFVQSHQGDSDRLELQEHTSGVGGCLSSYFRAQFILTQHQNNVLQHNRVEQKQQRIR